MQTCYEVHGSVLKHSSVQTLEGLVELYLNLELYYKGITNLTTSCHWCRIFPQWVTRQATTLSEIWVSLCLPLVAVYCITLGRCRRVKTVASIGNCCLQPILAPLFLHSFIHSFSPFHFFKILKRHYSKQSTKKSFWRSVTALANGC